MKIFEDSKLEASPAEVSCQTQEELAKSLRVTQQAISKRLKAMGIIQKQENRVPYELKPRYVERRFFACEHMLQRQNRQGFLHRIVLNAKKWVPYDNTKRIKSWGMPEHASTSTARPNIHRAKIMLCIWSDQLGVSYYELLKPSKTITGVGIERNICVCAEHRRRNGHRTKRDTTKLSFSMTMPDHVSLDRPRHTRKR